jgi:hypothetical protein
MRAALEVADIFRRHGDAFRTAQRGRLLPDQRRVMAAIEACRTGNRGKSPGNRLIMGPVTD